ncbi:MAG: hypothetical protein GX750_01560 [Clostridia bacterium]|nr:hypothetical protein [Clostridia bacterium]
MPDSKPFKNAQPEAVNSQSGKNSYKVYLKTDDMLFSGGNGTGLSFYIKYAENSTAENPIVIAKGVDEKGNEFERTININEIDPHNATIVEMRALEAYLNVDKGGGLSSLSLSAGNLGINDRIDFVAMFRKDINDLSLLRQDQLVQFYSNSMKTYLDFLDQKAR